VKKIVFFLVIAALAGFLFAEGAQEDDKPVTVHWSFWYPEPTEFIEAFNAEHDDITVEYEQMPSDSYLSLMNTRMMSGETPDIFAIRFPKIYEAGISEDLLVELTNENFMSVYDETLLEELKTDNGKLYAFPSQVSSWFGFYNKEIFAKYNIDVPQNYDELLDVCETLKQNGVVPIIQGCKDLWQTRHIYSPLEHSTYRTADWVEKLTSGQLGYNDEPFLGGLKNFETIVKNGYLFDGALSITFPQAWQLFCEGEAAMMSGGQWYVAQAFSNMDPKFDFGIMPFPINDKGQPVRMPATCFSGSHAVHNGDHMDATMTFAEWWAQPENLTLFASVSGEFTPGKGIDPPTDSSEAFRKISIFVSNNQKFQRVKMPADMTNIYFKALQDIISGSKTAIQAGDFLEDQWQAMQ
jgi:raffinose/stachyose/melibiose transport system substrate-binding protein